MFFLMEFTIFFFLIFKISVLVLNFIFRSVIVNIVQKNIKKLVFGILVFLMCYFICLSSSVVELDTIVLTNQLQFMGVLPCFPVKTKNRVKIGFHALVRSQKVQILTLFCTIIFCYYAAFGLVWSNEPFIIISLFFVLFSIDFFKKVYFTKRESFSKGFVYALFIFYLTGLILSESTLQIYRMFLYVCIIVILGFVNPRSQFAKKIYVRSLYLGSILKKDVESRQVIDLHLYCDLPLIQVFFENAPRGIIFLWSVLISSTVRNFLGLTNSSQFFCTCFICLFFTFKFFIYVYLQFGCNPSISEILTAGRSFVSNAIKYVPPVFFGAGLYGLENPHHVAEIVSEHAVLKGQHALGIRPNANISDETAIRDAFDINYNGGNISFDQIRDPNNPYRFNTHAIAEANRSFKAGEPVNSVEVRLHEQCTSTPGVARISNEDHAASRGFASGLTNGLGSSVFDDYFSKVKK